MQCTWQHWKNQHILLFYFDTMQNYIFILLFYELVRIQAFNFASWIYSCVFMLVQAMSTDLSAQICIALIRARLHMHCHVLMYVHVGSC